jgi:hypothetical protein
MEQRSSSSSIEKARIETKADFLLKLRANSGYIRLTKIRSFDSGRRNRLEEACWRHHCFAIRNRLFGARAKLALSHFTALRRTLGDPCWIPAAVATSLDNLESDLKSLASKAKRGRPSDSIARFFRQNMHHFVPPAHLSQKTSRFLSREETDEIFTELFGLVLGRTVSAVTFTRMRMRDRARNKEGAGEKYILPQ